VKYVPDDAAIGKSGSSVSVINFEYVNIYGLDFLFNKVFFLILGYKPFIMQFIR